MKGLAKPLVIWRDTPSSIEKMKKMAISFFLNNVNALRPKMSTKEGVSPDALLTGQAGNVRA